MFPLLNSALGNHTINIHLFEDGCIAFSPQTDFGSIVDKHKHLEVYINRLGIEIIDLENKDEEKHKFGYKIPYKQYPLLLEWLKSFNMYHNVKF